MTVSSRHEAVRAEVRAGDRVTRYFRAGAGRVVLLLRPAAATTAWSAAAAELAARCRVIVPDIPESPDFTSWLGDFLDGLGLESVTILADPALGEAAREFATREPDRVRLLAEVPSTQVTRTIPRDSPGT
jgi:pimeloyl-ACP methyl ester carboxylesterase